MEESDKQGGTKSFGPFSLLGRFRPKWHALSPPSSFWHQLAGYAFRPIFQRSLNDDNWDYRHKYLQNLFVNTQILGIRALFKVVLLCSGLWEMHDICAGEKPHLDSSCVVTNSFRTLSRTYTLKERPSNSGQAFVKAPLCCLHPTFTFTNPS